MAYGRYDIYFKSHTSIIVLYKQNNIEYNIRRPTAPVFYPNMVFVSNTAKIVYFRPLIFLYLTKTSRTDIIFLLIVLPFFLQNQLVIINRLRINISIIVRK